MLALLIILIFLSLITIIISLLMSGDSQGFSGALIGSSDLDLFKISKERGSKKALKWTMMTLGICFMIGSVIVRAYM